MSRKDQAQKRLEYAADRLANILRQIALKSGCAWTKGNDSDVRQIVRDIVKAAVEEAWGEAEI